MSSDSKGSVSEKRSMMVVLCAVQILRIQFLIDRVNREKTRGHAWLMHIQNVNLPVDVEVEMSLSDWSGNLEPTRGVISLARKSPGSIQIWSS